MLSSGLKFAALSQFALTPDLSIFIFNFINQKGLREIKTIAQGHAARN